MSKPLEIRDATGVANVATALRDLADHIDAIGEGRTVVCVIGVGHAATLYVVGGNLPDLLAGTAEYLGGIVGSLIDGNPSTH
jgi:predicted butyrate kinase (DUF1464 family)